MTWDRRGEGSRDFTDSEYRRVVAHVAALPSLARYEDIAAATGVGGRTVRAILSAADGVEFVLVTGDAGAGVARTSDESERGTARLRSQARRMLERADRRERWSSANLVRVQSKLW